MSYFVTGTDTGVGKTLVSCALLQAFAAQGKRVAGFKPVAAGCDEHDHNDDAIRLRAVSSMQLTYGQVNPYCFHHAIAPHLAARNSGVRIDFSRILTSYRELAGQADEVIVEGAGGFLVPLNEKQTSADLAKALELPVIMVVGMRLGCLNHALLTMRAITDYQLECAGWVANVLDADGATRRCTKSRQFTIQQAGCEIDTEASGAGVPSGRLLPQTAGYASSVSKADMPALQENIDALRERIAAPLLGVIPNMAEPDAKSAAQYLDLGVLDRKTIDPRTRPL